MPNEFTQYSEIPDSYNIEKTGILGVDAETRYTVSDYMDVGYLEYQRKLFMVL